MLIDLHRSFSEYASASADVQDEDWGAFLGLRKGAHTWSDLHEKPLVVVLGEAGIGKTIEFKHEVARLTAEGKAAFFLPLNQLQESDSWTLALTGCDDAYTTWAASTALGYFFLDAVDEARLRSHADFERALTVVQRALGPHLSRARVAISSRITDWSTEGVRTAVDTRLATPIQRALAAKSASERPLLLDETSSVSLPPDAEASKVEVLVVALATPFQTPRHGVAPTPSRSRRWSCFGRRSKMVTTSSWRPVPWTFSGWLAFGISERRLAPTATSLRSTLQTAFGNSMTATKLPARSCRLTSSGQEQLRSPRPQSSEAPRTSSWNRALFRPKVSSPHTPS